MPGLSKAEWIFKSQILTSVLVCFCAGLAGVLDLLKDRGELTDTVQWAGRNTDIMAAQVHHITCP